MSRPRRRKPSSSTNSPPLAAHALAPPAADPDAYYYDHDAAERAVAFFARYLRHIRGALGGKPLALDPWQQTRIIRPLFGWKRRRDGLRRFRSLYLEVPRGNGKTTLIVGIGYLLLLCDREAGAEIYSAAADKGQARTAFDLALAQHALCPAFQSRIEAYRDTLTVPATASKWAVITGDAFNKHGYNAHGILIDELHAHRSRDLYDVLQSSTIKRTQPLTVCITTAGYDRASICWEIHEHAAHILAGTRQDDSMLPVIYAAPEDADWTDPAVWAAANPGYGVSVNPEVLQRECNVALHSPRAENTFRQLYLNQWTSQQSRWLPMKTWDAAPPFDPATLADRPCYGGLDLASTTDLAAFALIFPPLTETEAGFWDCLLWYWLPGENLREKEAQDRADYLRWIKAGHIRPTEGNEIDDDTIAADVQTLAAPYALREIGFDRWGARLLRRRLEDAGLTMVDFGQGFRDMSPACRDLEKLVLAGRLRHNGNPVLRWNADNCAVLKDPAGNIKPAKHKSSSRIDGIVALLMALGRATASESHQSIYEKRGLLDL